MYADCWENKPPGLAWLNALGFLAAGGNAIGPWLLPPVFMTVTLMVVWSAARKVFHERTARKAVLVIALVYALRLYDTPSINPDFFASLFELMGVLLLIRAIVPRLHPVGATDEDGSMDDAEDFPAYVLCAMSGLMFAGATSIKQVGCIGFVILALILLVVAVRNPEFRSNTLRALLAAWGGFALGLGAVAAVLWQQGTLAEAGRAMFSFNTGLMNLDALSAAFARRAVIRGELAPLLLPLWLGLTGMVMSFWYRRYGGFPLLVAIGVAVWWVLALVLAGMGPSKSMRYWQATFPPMLVLAAVGLHYIQLAQSRLGHPERLTLFVLAATVAIALVRPALVELRAGLAGSYAEADTHPNERDRLGEVAARVRELTATGDRIYVLDYASGIYVYADRAAAMRFNYPRSAEQCEEILSRLESGAAKLLIVPERPAAEFRQFCDEDCRERLRKIVEGCPRVESVQGYGLHECANGAK